MTTIQQHQIIEASAGTGKTYTIENEVVRLIAEEGIPLSEILIVTFTEKATGELRRRIRRKLESAWQGNKYTSINNTQLRASIDTFDDAAIYTIHGFCMRMLSEYAFEAGLPFTQQQLDDPQLSDRLFSRSLRGYWRRNILTTDDPMRCRDAVKNDFYKNDIQSVANRFMPGDELIPSTSSKLLSTKVAIVDIITGLKPSFGTIPDNVSDADFIKKINALGIHAATRKSLVTHFTSLLTIVDMYNKQGMTDEVADNFFAWNPTESAINKFDLLVDNGVLKENDVANLKRLLSLKVELVAIVKSHAIMQLFNSKKRYKSDGGFIDFNDMLLLMREALLPPSPLIDILRKRFQVALVDEFQDTDQIQWDIFCNVFTGDDTHRLIVVGDPKQAIYGFRGANVKIYNAALNSLVANAANKRSLDTNWRSYPPLISALNELFSEKSLWFNKATETSHTDIQSPPPPDIRSRLYADESGRRPLTIVEFPGDITGSKAKFSYAFFIAREIKHLMESNIEIVEWRDNKAFKRELHFGDICILIRARTELSAIKYALREENIPFTFSKQGGLFSTIEAEEWRYLLRSIATPDNPGAVLTALLTRFFKCSPETLDNYTLLPVSHPVKVMFSHWHHLAENRMWSQLFQQILSDTGILERELATDDGERIVTNHQHLIQILHEQAVRTRGTINDLILFLDTKCLRKDDDNTDLQRIETERRKVKILTMHGSKGLEFEVVFIAGGFTASKMRSSSGYTTDKGRKYFFNEDKKLKEEQKNEEDADSRRLFYVALTRAKYKLYLPLFTNPKSKGAFSGFIATAINNAWPDKKAVDGNKIGFINVDDRNVPYWDAPVDDDTDVELISLTDTISEIDESLITIPVTNHEWGHRITRVHSFSSLSQHSSSPTEVPVLRFTAEDNQAEEKSPITDDATDTGIIDVDSLPHGAQTGTLLHAILEEIDYSAVLNAADHLTLLAENSPTLATISSLVDRYPLSEDIPAENYYEKIAAIVWRTLQTPMPFLNNTRLAELTDCRHELEFWLPATTITDTIPDITLSNNYLSGFIDLIFRHDNRYYILDWKSNWSPTGDYSRQSLNNIIKNNNYDLQYSIYYLALDRFLRMSLPGYNPDTHMGGVCYLFLRGVGDGDNGIYYVPGDEIILSDIYKDVATRLKYKTTEVN